MRDPDAPDAAPGHVAVRFLFLRLVALAYLIAFGSAWIQVEGLIGPHGILPAGEYLGAVRDRLGAGAYVRLPTLAWLAPGDPPLHAICAAGVVLSAGALAGLAPVACFAGAWVLYHSLCAVGQLFFGYQWDVLLLEVGFLAILWSPWVLRSGLDRDPVPSPVVLWLVRLLAFRLFFASGFGKLAGGDPTWTGLTALTVHYETQPLPSALGWWFHQAPEAFHRFACAATLAIQIVGAVLVFGPRPARLVACVALVGHQVLIAATGSYNFFNLLAIALCVSLLDDRVLGRPGFGRFLAARGPDPVPPPWKRRGRWVLAPVAAVLVAASLVDVGGTLVRSRLSGGPLAPVLDALAPLRLVNSYGLFLNMTTERPEIVIEGSRDGVLWIPYAFPWKPGDPARRPGYAAPHQPRLDWQLWFAALRGYRRAPWMQRLYLCLLEGRPEVLALLDGNPFPGGPPTQLRAVLYDYRFTDRETRRATGNWWRRERVGLYSPVVRLPSPPLR